MFHFPIVQLALLAATWCISNSEQSPQIRKSIALATVTDTHIGEGCNGVLTYEACGPIRALTDAVNKMNNLNLDGVFVTGDITSSALKEEFVIARQILNGLKVPWWPVLGNHDSWPYTRNSNGSFDQSDSAIGDRYFAEVFGDLLVAEKESQTKFQISGWPQGLCKNGDFPSTESWFHNFEISFPSFSQNFKIFALDWVARGDALPEPGVGPEAELHDFSCGSFEWLENHLSSLSQVSSNATFFFMQHHPFHNRDILDPLGKNVFYNFTFDDKQDVKVQEMISKYFVPSSLLGIQAGHMHRWFDGAAFTQFTAINDGWKQVPEWETPACKGWFVDADYLSSIQVFTFETEDREPESASVYLANVKGWWRLPSGEWSFKPVKGQGQTEVLPPVYAH